MKYVTFKDDEEIRPMTFIWRLDENIKYHLPEMKKALKYGGKIVVIEIKEERDFNINNI